MTFLKCSFCGADQRAVQTLIAGPDVYICDGCVAIAADIVRERVPDLTVAQIEAPDERVRRIESAAWTAIDAVREAVAPLHRLLAEKARAADAAQVAGGSPVDGR